MKTYKIFFALCVLVLISCETSDDESRPDDDGKNVNSDYVVLQDNDGILTTQFLNADAETITLNSKQTSLVSKAVPQLHYSSGAVFLQYHKNDTCSGTITKHDFETDQSTEIVVFEDLNDCNLTATAIVQTDEAIYISYVLTNTNPNSYGIRVIDMSAADFSFVDISIEKKPIDLAIANERLFILTFDEQITDENGVVVMELADNSLIHERALGYDARRIFRNAQDNVIVGYDELHGNLNSETLAISYTQYEDETAPKFAFSSSRNFDSQGVLYYPSDPGTNSTYPLVASSYNFESNLVILYVYDELLSEEQRNFEYKIKTTSAVNFDNENRLVLVGYEKIEGEKKGGLLRIKLNSTNEITAIDNIDLDGVPFEIFVQQ